MRHRHRNTHITAPPAHFWGLVAVFEFTYWFGVAVALLDNGWWDAALGLPLGGVWWYAFHKVDRVVAERDQLLDWELGSRG